MGRPEYCTDGKGSGYSSWFHGYRTEVWCVLNTVLMERDLGTVAGSMVTEQRFRAFLLLSTAVGSMSTEHGSINL